MKKIFITIVLILSLIPLMGFKEIVLNNYIQHPSYLEVSVTFNYLLPSYLKNSSGVPLFNDTLIAKNYGYMVDSVGTTLCISWIGIITSNSTTLSGIGTDIVNKYNAIQTNINNLTLTPYDTLVGHWFDGTWH